MSEELKERCATCTAAERCREAFGRFWIEKSRGGIGCNCRLPVAEARRAEPWESRVYTSRRREGGVFKPRKRRITQGRML